MDVNPKFKLVLVISLTLVFAACSKDPKTAESIFPQEAACIGAQVIKNKFIVRWSDGRVTVETGENREQFIKDFVEPNLQNLDHVEHDQVISLKPVAQDGLIRATAFADNWGISRISAPSAWQNGVRGNDVVVAVIDSGVELTHSQLSNQLWTNSGEVGTDSRGNDKRSNDIDDDGNGYVDDVHGYDFILSRGDVGDTSGHGSHVAGIIAAEHNDTTAQTGYVQGVAPGAKIMALDFIDQTGGGTLGAAMEAIDYAADNGAKIINASWGGSVCSQELGQKISSLSSRGVLFVAAAGNSSSNIDQNPEYPAAFQLNAQITVGSSGLGDYMAEHSNFSINRVHLFAPGFEIYSTVPFNSIQAMSGTSMATPFVAGVAALLWSHRPSASMSQIKQAILESVDVFNDFQNITSGRLNADRAVSKIEQIVP